MSDTRIVVATWSALKNLASGRLGYLGGLASGNLVDSGASHALYESVQYLPDHALRHSSYCFVAVSDLLAGVRGGLLPEGLLSPVPVDQIEIASFTSSVRRKEFLADLESSGLPMLPFTTHVWPAPEQRVETSSGNSKLVESIRLLDLHFGYQERITAAALCAAALGSDRTEAILALRSNEPTERYKRLAAWASCAHGVVDSEGRWNRTSIQLVLQSLKQHGFVDDVESYQLLLREKKWTGKGVISPMVTAMLLLARTEGGSPEDFTNMMLNLDGIAMSPGYGLADAMIYVAAAFGRHHVPAQQAVRVEVASTMVRDEIAFALANFNRESARRIKADLAAARDEAVLTAPSREVGMRVELNEEPVVNVTKPKRARAVKGKPRATKSVANDDAPLVNAEVIGVDASRQLAPEGASLLPLETIPSDGTHAGHVGESAGDRTVEITPDPNFPSPEVSVSATETGMAPQREDSLGLEKL